VSVGLLLITHRPLGADLLRVATAIFGTCPARAEALEVENDSPCEVACAEAERLAAVLDMGDGVLVLTDIYGATPARVATTLLSRPGRRLLAGVNLPMVVRALNYAELDLDTVAERALAGGRDGVRACPGTDTEN
jgi:mannose PTS system EIIA component